MKIIVGLGNPGKEYENTRHNAGFMMVSRLAEDLQFSLDKKLEAEVAKSGGLILVKPQTYMNESGRVVRKIMDFYKLSLNDLVIVHDDLDIELGEWKIQKGVGPKIHNGVNSVEQYMGSKDFLRVRLGVDNRKKEMTSLSGADYVLARFGKEEGEIMGKVILDVIKELSVTLDA
jgi:PTH1 family peptidyl-tRNA hydrolase